MLEGETGTGRWAIKGAKSRKIRVFVLTSAVVIAAGTFLWAFPDRKPSPSMTITLWQSPTHDCCAKWARYIQLKGYHVVVSYVDDMIPIKAELGIPDIVRSCHTAKLGDYLIEGHVPAAALKKLLDERPLLNGIALPGMPAGPPGMGGAPGTYRVVGFTAGGRASRFADVGI